MELPEPANVEEKELCNLGAIATGNALSQLIVRTHAADLDAATRRKYEDAFDALDVGNDGILDDFELAITIHKWYDHWKFEGAQHVACMVVKEIMGDANVGITKEEWVCSNVAMTMVNNMMLHTRYFQMLDADGDNLISANDLMSRGFQMSDIPGIFAQIKDSVNPSVNPYPGFPTIAISFTEFRQAMGCRPAYVMRQYKKEGENNEDVGLEYW